MIAGHGTAHHVETLVRGYRRAKKLNDPELANQQHEHRSFEYHRGDDGSLVFKGRLVHEGGFGCEKHATGKVVFTDPAGMKIEGISALIAPINSAGTVLSQPPIKTAASIG